MFTGLVIANVSQLKPGTELKSGKTVEVDSNGRPPYIFNVVAGRFPNRNIKAGTVAENSGFEHGKSYLIQIRETEATEYGRQFQWTKLNEVSAMDIIDATEKLGNAELFEVEAVEAPKSQSAAPKATPLVKS